MSNATHPTPHTHVVGIGSCHGCRHFTITHKAQRPYGCRAFGLMSRQHPAREILTTSGEACRMRSASASTPFTLEGGSS